MADAPVVTPAAPAATTTTPAPGAPAAPQLNLDTIVAGLKAAGINPETLEMALAVDGETMNVPLAVARNRAMKSSGADKRFSEAKAIRDAIDHAYQEGSKNPARLWEAIEQLGINGDDFALDRVEAALKREAALSRETPEQRKLREELETLKRGKAEDERKAAAAKQQAERAQFFQSQGKMLYDAVEKTSLPHTDATALRMVNIMDRALEQDIELDPASLAHYAEQEVMAEVAAVLAAQKDVKKRRRLVGEDLLKAILEGDVESVASAPGISNERTEAPPSRIENEDGSATVRFKPAKRSKPESQAIRELTKALRSGNMPRPV